MPKINPNNPPVPTASGDAGGAAFYRAADLAARYKVHVITIWKWVSNGNLPPPTRLGPNTRAWRSDLIERWEAQRSSPRSAEAGQ